MGVFISVASVLFALLAAILWLWSTLIQIPILGSGWGRLVSTMPDGRQEVGTDAFYLARRASQPRRAY